ncbi:MAG TPA: archaetidylserine decarboxylase [Candidatus Competibacteraceae bacterium]|nr:archaetidylserine decarboxylase [Candidatus Competibacteraceae bacterium]
MARDTATPRGREAGPGWFERLRTAPQYLYPQRRLSGLVYRLTRIRAPWFKNASIRVFVRLFRVDLSEAAEPDPRAYPHFNAFFTRALRPGVRPIAAGSDELCCPVDGTVSQAGAIDGDRLYQAKGQWYTVAGLLGDDASLGLRFQGGRFATLYLSPRDYHRIHMPYAGCLTQMIHVPGKLFSVSPLSTRVVPRLFARNERVVTLFETEFGPMAVILVGAINVSSMETVWAGTLTPPYAKTIRRWYYPAAGAGRVFLDKGAELGRFNMGSTVILLFPPGAVELDPALRPDAPVRLGQVLARRM